ncbi:MAG: N-6 DNA methylase [Verrucomicrobia bacterium]|nr:N-6 DNA methylase [Verrucomicrobiota bacterium]
MSDSLILREESPAYDAGGAPAPLADYLRKLERTLRRGDATEHTHRPALKELLESLDSRIVAVNEPKRSACGAPDFAISRTADELSLGFIEAKDIGVSLDEAAKSEQLKRYRGAFSNLLLTDYLEFRWFVNGDERDRVRLGEVRAGKIVPAAAGLAKAAKLLTEFLDREPIRLDSAEELARRLARLTHLIRDAIVVAFQTGNASELLTGWRTVFTETLLPELADDAKVPDFADMFAQTLAYGLFSARAMSGTSAKFTLAEAAKLIPRTNPFLRDFFDNITGPKLDDEAFAGYVQDLVTLLECADMATILEDFGRGIGAGRRRDPVVHFYETFLAAYDPKLRELRGVYYTPEPVVSYIVESIDWLLREKFGLKDGLADKSKIAFTREEKGKTIDDETHRVLILDPATGTGTFLFEVIETIREQFEKNHKAGQWPSYVHEHLLPRLFGFELLMAPYAVAHFKIGLELSGRHLPELFRAKWAYKFTEKERLNIFLTNTLEDIEHVAQVAGPLAALSREANEAVAIKRHRPVLVVLGNPPYANFGRQNRNDYILNLLADYKRGLNEKKINLDDDFIKFLRWAHERVARTGQGVVGYITNNVYLDGLTHRRMRESLLESFDEIYILNLHGSSKKQETAPDGSKDDNVFDITVGVAIALFVKLPPGSKGAKKGKHATVHHADLWGLRKTKYDWLGRNNATSTTWTSFAPDKPEYRFVPRNAEHEEEWNKGWGLRDIFPVSNNGLKTDRDKLFFDFDRQVLERRMTTFFARDLPLDFAETFNIKDSSSYDIETRRRECKWNAKAIRRCLYRPFDFRWLYYDIGLTSRPAETVMRHLLADENLALCALRQSRRSEEGAFLATNALVNKDVVSLFDIGTVFPLYLYANGDLPDGDLFEHANGRRPNLSKEFVADLETQLGLTFVPDGRGNLKKTFGPEDVFHYVYAIFYAPSYRERYAEFLKLDFARVPVTSEANLFRRLCACGQKLVASHTMRAGDATEISFDVPGDNMVEQVVYVPPISQAVDGHRLSQRKQKLAARRADGLKPGRRGRVYINASQFFEGITPPVWQFRIGGYQVCEKWLKDRRGRALEHDDLEHYQHTVSALAETRHLMAQVDSLIADHGGWPLA